MRLLFPDMHGTLTGNLATAFSKIGIEMMVPDHSFANVITYGKKWSEQELKEHIPLASTISYEECVTNPPDFIVVSCWEVFSDVFNHLVTKCPTSKIVFYAGNNSVPYPANLVKNILCADIQTFERFKSKNCLFYLPYMDYENFQFKGTSDSNKINSYIMHYQKLFQFSYSIAESVIKNTSFIEYSIFDGNISRPALPDLMRNSIATLHIKEMEGYGYSIIESLAVGRPVILYRPFTINKSFSRWCIDEKSSIYFTTAEEYRTKITRIFSDEEYRHSLQTSTAKTIREIINNDEQCSNLKTFMERIV